MIKKLVAGLGAGALILSMAGPALANGLIHIDKAYVENGAIAVADTGGNSQDNVAIAEKGKWNSASAGTSSGSRNMTTGDADATAKAVVIANTHLGCGCEDPYLFSKDKAEVYNGAGAMALTGGNSQDDYAYAGKGKHLTASAGDDGGSRNLITGSASSTAKAFVLVNTHVSGW